MKLFIEHVLEELYKIGKNYNYHVSLSTTKDADNYMRGSMQFFDNFYNTHFEIVFTYPENHPKLNYVFFILDNHTRIKIVEKNESKLKMIDSIQELALKEIDVNLTRGADIRSLLQQVEEIISSPPPM